MAGSVAAVAVAVAVAGLVASASAGSALRVAGRGIALKIVRAVTRESLDLILRLLPLPSTRPPRLTRRTSRRL